MATVIQIKRSANATAPSTTNLEEGELAYSYDSAGNGANAILYIEALDSGASPVIHKLGGKYYTDIIDAATNTNTGNTLVKRDTNGDFLAGNITARLYGTSNAAVQLLTPRLINLSGDLEGNVSFNGTADVTIVANVRPNSVELGTDTTGNYVANIIPGSGIEVSNGLGEGCTPTISLTNTGVLASTYGGASNVPVLVVDAFGRITSASNASISTDLGISGNVGTDVVSLATENLNVVGGTGITTSIASNTISIINTGVVSLTGTANEVTVSAANGSVTIGLPDDVTITRDLSINGNLYVTGNVVSLPVENLVVEDSLIQLANNNISTDLIDIGFYGSYQQGGGEHEHAGLFRDASDSGKFKLFEGLQGQGNLTSTVNTSGTGYSIATLVANLTGGTVTGLAANIAVSDGGTGRGTLTTNAVIYGQGASAVGLATGTAGQILQIDNSGVPIFALLDGGSY